MQIDNFVLIIGAAKCGTSSLFNYLAEHPEISPCRVKEPHFFSQSQNFALGADYYQSLFDWDEEQHKFALEATPGYSRATNTNLQKAADYIASFKVKNNVNFKFIYLIRDPIERIESHYTHLAAWNQEPNKKPIQAGLDPEIIDVSKYAMQIEEYLKHFSQEDILILNFGDLKHNPHLVMSKICQFLEIDRDYLFKGLNTVHNSNKDRIAIKIPGWRIIRKSLAMRTIAGLTPKAIKQSFRKVFGKKINNFVRLSATQRNYVLDRLRSDAKKLENYGVDISKWNI